MAKDSWWEDMKERDEIQHADIQSPTLLSPLELFSPVNSLKSKQAGEISSHYIQ